MTPTNGSTSTPIILNDEDGDDYENYELLDLNQFPDDDDDLDQYTANHNDTNVNFEKIPQAYCNNIIRSHGTHKCGFSKLPDFSKTRFSFHSNFIVPATSTFHDPPEQPVQIHRQQPSPKQLVDILFTRSGQKQFSFLDITGQSELISLLEPNGSAKSIINWAEESNFDQNQQRAFEIITSSFVLSYYNASDTTKSTRSSYHAERKKLKFLAHHNTQENDQLICFLHGPGGSGKSAVINLVLLYCKNFCNYIWSDFQSNERVIVVTALTGVAATLLNGETTHSALYLNQKKDISREQIQFWSQTKMIIIDEISFAHKNDIVLINSKLAKLKQNPHH